MNERVQAIHTAIEFIEGRLTEPLAVAEIAATAGYSLYHFIRTFNQIVQHTPYDYLMRRRLSAAALELVNSERRVIDIALDYQFNNHETFTRAFGRVFGMPPMRWREQGIADHRFLMPALDRDYLEYLNSPDFRPPQLVKIDQIILAGLMTPLTENSEEIQALWRNLREVYQILPINLGRPDYWGVRILPQVPGGTSFYLAGFKIPSFESAPGVFVTKVIPLENTICLSQLNWMANLDLALTVLYHTFLPKTDLILNEPLEIEHFGERREIFLPVRGLLEVKTYSSNQKDRSKQLK